jgi:5-methylcytosine-specific restriction endonuclease McrA
MQLPRTEPDYAALSKRVDNEFECKHPDKTIRKKLAADGAISIWNQCCRCGHKVGIAIKKASMTPIQIEALPLWDTQLESTFYGEKKKYLDQAYAADKKRCSDTWHRAYAQYLQTPEWLRRRKLVMLRAQGICEGCRESEAVDVHHLTYSEAGEEFLFQLVALCPKCHARWHGLLQPTGDATHQPPTQPRPVPIGAAL